MISLPNFNKQLLIATLATMGDIHLSSKDYPNAALFYLYALKTANYTRYFNFQSKNLIKLSKCLSKMMNRRLAMNCLLKALEFALNYDDYGEELRVYDNMSVLYLEGEDTAMARYMHNR